MLERQYYTTSQAARLLAVSPDTVLRWVRQGKISSYNTPGGHSRIPREAVEQMLHSPQQPVSRTEPPVLPYHYCWEFYGDKGEIKPACRECVVYRSRARRCYEMRDIPEQFGHLKLHCHSDCNACDYYEKVRGQGTSVLLVTRNRHLRYSMLSEARKADIIVRGASDEYECATILDEFRPDYIVLDGTFGRKRTQDICRHLSSDKRIPFTKIILTSREDFNKDCFEGRIFCWIEKPFTFAQLRCCLGQAE